MRKDLLIVFDVAFPFFKGGAQRRFYEVARRLGHEKRSIGWLTFKHWEGSERKELENIEYISIGKSPEFYNKKGSRSKTEPLIFLFGVLKKISIFREYKTIWIGQWPILHIIPILIFAKIYKNNVVVDWWEVWGNLWLKYSKSIGWIGYLLEKGTLHAIRLMGGRIVTDCSLEKSRLIDVVNDESIIFSLTNGVPKDEIGDLEELPKYEYDIGCFGRLKNHKRVDLLLDSIAILKHHHGIKAKTAIIGDGPERKNLERLSESLDIVDEVTFYGQIEEIKDCYKILKVCKLSVVSTMAGGGGNLTLLECFGCGLPVVAFKSDDGLDPELIDNWVNGVLVDPPNGEEMAAVLGKILNNDELQINLRKGAIIKSKQHDWSKISKSYKKLLILE